MNDNPNRILVDAKAVLTDVEDAWADLPADQGLVHKVHCFPDRAVRGGRPRLAEIRFETLTDRQRTDVREKLETWAANLAQGARARNTVDALRRDLKIFSS